MAAGRFESCHTYFVKRFMAHTSDRVHRTMAEYVPAPLLAHASRVGAACALLGDMFYIASGGLAAQSSAEGWARGLGGGLGIALQLVGVSFQDRPQTANTFRDYQAMPVWSYVCLRIKQIAQPHKHVKQMMGLGWILAGCAFLTSGVLAYRPFEGPLAWLCLRLGWLPCSLKMSQPLGGGLA